MSVHRGMFSSSEVFSTPGDTMSTSRDILSMSGDVQYIEEYHDSCGGYHEYIGCSVYLRNIMSTSGCSVYRRDIMIHLIYVENPRCTHDIRSNRKKSAKVCLPLLPPISDHVIIQLRGYFSFIFNTPVHSVMCKKLHNCYLSSVRSHDLKWVVTSVNKR